MKKALFLSLSILAVIIFVQTTAFACGCPARNQNTARAVAEEFKTSSLVFVGKVMEAKWLPVSDKTTANSFVYPEVLTLKFAAREWLKGEPRKELIWQTSSVRYPVMNVATGGSNCEYYFATGKTYLVYATEINGKLIADVCGGTGEIEKAEADITELRKLNRTRKKMNTRL